MKKRVRIYKSPESEGKFINKTAQFLSKAQMGGTFDYNNMGYPGTNQQQSNSLSEDELMSVVLTDISNSEPKENIVIKVSTVYGLDPMQAEQFVNQVYNYVEQQRKAELDLINPENEEDIEEEENASIMAEEIAETNIGTKKQKPTGTEMSNEMILEDDVNSQMLLEDDEADMMRYGGYVRAQEGMEIPIQMPDVSSYLPSGMEDYLNGNVDPLYGQAWERPEITMESELSEEKYDGMPSKKSYVNSVLKLVKKQMGGDSAAPASAKLNDDNADPTGANVRQKSLDKFIGSIKNQSAMALAKEQAEQEYEQMMQQYAMAQQGGIVNNPFADEYGNLQKFIGGGDEDFTQGDLDDMYSKDTANADFPMAQRGMMVRNLFPANVMPTQYTQMRGVPYDPRTGKPVANYIPGVGTGINKIDVTKSGWLTGRPKKYTITYGTQEMDPRKQNLITLPGSGTQTAETQARRPDRQRMDVSDFDLRTKMAIRQGERQVARNNKKLGRHPELFEMGSYADVNNVPTQVINRNIPLPPFTSEQQNYLKQSLTVPETPAGAPMSVPFSYDQLYNTAGPMNTEMQYGGNLEKFIPRAQDGFQSPVVYTNNPAMQGMTQVELTAPNPGIQGLGASSMDTGFMNTNVPTRNQSDDLNQYTVDPTQIGSQQAKNVYQGPEEDVSVDYKVKNSFDPEAYLNVANAGIRGVTGILNRRDGARQESKMYDNLTADNLYASDPSKDRGDYDTNSGLYRLDEMGQKWNSRSKQYGGNIYQDGGMVEGDEVDMTEEELAEFIANGGEVEYL
jgi:hypothetical protein